MYSSKPSLWETGRKSRSSKLSFATQWVQGWLGAHKTLAQNQTHTHNETVQWTKMLGARPDNLFLTLEIYKVKVEIRL